MKKQLLLRICAVSAISILAFSCKKDASPTQKGLSVSKSDFAASTLTTDNVYVSGFYFNSGNDYARYWFNTTTLVPLTAGTPASNGDANDIDVSSSGDVYTIGQKNTSITNDGVVWKNTTIYSLPNPSGFTGPFVTPRMVYANGNDIYIVGESYFSGSDHRATLWKIPGGNMAALTVQSLSTTSNTDAYGVTVTTAGDVYISGTVGTTAGGNACYWKISGGVTTGPTTLPGPVAGGQPQIVSISNDVYIGFTVYPNSIYLYKNGAVYTPGLTGTPLNSAINLSLATHGSDLYMSVLGTNNPSTTIGTVFYWNVTSAPTTAHTFTDASYCATRKGCLAVGASGDVYIAGDYSSPATGCVWKNGVVTSLYAGAGNTITGISVK